MNMILVFLAVVAVSLSEVAGNPCSEPFERGPCRGYHRVWAFDQSSGTCVPRVYGGCRGNNNRFEDKETCQQICLG
ncbi:unnamed protein product [Mesocestoides corti]|uniref:BPTI/Kunitz inhibitor domain-containing protein n=1 Tax=Mesocestoides corti TaxID=53468 RepID=A0A0R3U6K2_MESCO|nr:unnamed protein product [Mesocestoides corti]